LNKEIPYHQNYAFFRRYAPGGGTVTWQTVESGFEVTPTLAGNNAHLKIVPRIAYDDRQNAVIRFFGAQAELTIPLGRWVEIGADRAAYATMLFPVVAPGISTVYEGYQWYSFFIRSLSKNANKTNETET
jgi:hypothetical protein